MWCIYSEENAATGVDITASVASPKNVWHIDLLRVVDNAGDTFTKFRQCCKRRKRMRFSR